MKGTRGDLRTWGNLVLLGLCSWTGVRVAAPNPVRNLSVEAQTTSSVTLSWTEPAGPDPSNYTYWIQWTGNETKSTTSTSVIVDGLQPGSLYEFVVWVEKNGVSSPNKTCNATTAPNPVRNLSVEAQTTSSVTLSWTEPAGPDPSNYTYWIQWTGNETKSTTSTSVIVDGLQPGSLYEFVVWVEKNGVSSPNKTCNATTVPNAVTSLGTQDQTNSSITLSWTAPLGPDQPPYTYWVSWVKEGIIAINTQDTPDTSITLKELEAGSLYTFTVWAERNGVSSDSRTLTEATAPNRVTDLHNETQTNSSITLGWKAPTDSRSQTYTYWVQWAPGGHPQGKQDPREHQASQIGRTNETRYEVQALEPGTLYNLSVWAERNNAASWAQSLLASTAPSPVTIMSCISTSGGYGVILTWSCPQGGYEAFEWQVGGQGDSQNRSSCGRSVSVSDLRPAQSYPATVTTIWDGMRAPSVSVTCHTDNAGVIAGAIFGVILFLILVGLLIFFLKKRHNKSQREPAPRGLVFSLSKDILAEDFADHIRKNEMDSNYGFEKEYQQLYLESHNQSQTVASAPENGAKNRYRNVLPYDWSRVSLKPLQDEPGSDYINASFMPGLENPQEFIAAQGPLPQTVGDFWRLVWEQQSHTLVMMTNCVESGQVKCEHYWPLDTKPCTYGHLQVTLEGEEVLENWTVRDLKLWHMQEQKMLPIRQFHYMTWPDHGVPYSPDPILAFWKMLRQWLDRTVGGGPPIIHCRSGGSTDSEEEEDDDEEDEDDGDGRVAGGGAGPPSYPSPGPQPPGPSWTATFDSVPTDALTGPRDSGEKEPSSGLFAPQGSHSIPRDLPALSLAGPVACTTLQLRSQDPVSPSAPQEATDGSKVAEPSAPCQSLVSIGDLQATLRGTCSTPSSLDSATRDPATSVPASGACQHPQTTEGEKSPEPSGLPHSQSAQALEPPPMPNGSAPGGPASLGSQ